MPSAFRPDTEFRYGPKKIFRPQPVHYQQIIEEANVIRDFLVGIDRQGLPAPVEAAMRWKESSRFLDDIRSAPARGEWPPFDIAPLFALAQHHGVPTRLLDWTERPFVAAYFAAVEAVRRMLIGLQTDGEFAVWALDPTRARALLWQDLFNRMEPDLHLVRPPRSSNPNMRAQEGVFALLVDSKRGWNDEAYYPPLNHLVQQRIQERAAKRDSDTMPFLWKLVLPVSESGRLLRMLADEWVSAMHLYPGLDGVVRGLRERALWDFEPRSEIE